MRRTIGMSMTELRLNERQLNELELLLAGAFGPGRDYLLPNTSAQGTSDVLVPTLYAEREVSPRERLELVDSEGTAVAALRVQDSRADGHGFWLSGRVDAGRPFGHRTLAERRLTRPDSKLGPATLVIGDPPPRTDARWSPNESALFVVPDEGDPAETLERFMAIPEMLRVHAMILPVPAAHHLNESERGAFLAELLASLIAGEVTVMRGDQRAGSGLVILLTGLSGSGKSTIAKALVERLRLTDPRRTTLLDGDEVRAMLSSGLGFSREDRELNVRRIGWVASLVCEHGGIAVCAPIAPYESMRAEFRAMAERHGRFILVYVSTPLEVCEERDRKGLYARARAGEIQQFTGISDPYEVPTDADVVVDASAMDVGSCVQRVLAEVARQ